ncbi:U3 small nucleolar RNA-associated protein 18 homolog isoform X2 [Bombina bombina]|uniref:U3 small nucleolar RNA-associated protein 18 homolog isoform X2 n=1 Tax=Bombina bombina TaxID=8345 RepID=UPI00235AB785|nr:U3 small nucleolar RNA-associated protein 18 homolog isoform X2 [Bombina bombina]
MHPAETKTRGKKGTSPRKRTSSQDNEEEEQKAKHLRMLAEKPEVEKCLEELVFGGEDEFVERLIGDSQVKSTISGNLLDSDSDDEGTDKALPVAKKPAWVDEEDEADESIEMTHRYRRDIRLSKNERTLAKEKLQTRLKEQFQKAMGGVPSWACIDQKRSTKEDDDLEEDNEDNLLSKTGNLLATSSYLPKGILQIRKCLNANHERPSEGPLTSVQFHPLAQVIMTAGLDRAISLFQVDGRLNPKIQSIHLEKFPIFKAQFTADGEQVIATGVRSKMFYVYDMMGGNIIPVPKIRGLDEKCIQQFEVSPDGSFLLLNGSAGYLHLLSMKTKELIGSLKLNGKSVKAAFFPDSSKIYSIADDGDVYIWDVNSRRCLNRFTDDGNLRGTSIALSKSGQYVACGSNSGVVNIYNHADCIQEKNPKPLKSIMNLVTSATSLVFNAKSEILAVASNAIDDAVKLVHIPSFNVFSNFPVQTKRKTIHFARALDFSPHSGFFSIANNKGEALLYRIKHYTDF